MKKKISKISDRVKILLEEYPVLRDNDNRLISNYYAVELGLRGHEIETFKPFLDLLSKGQIAFPDSITRARRKLQENNESLRGKNYGNRQSNQKKTVEDINKIK